MIKAEPTLEERLRALQTAGLLAWNGQILEPIEPLAINRGERTLAELIVEMRQ